MEDETLAVIARLVRTGSYPKDRVLEIVCEELHEPGEIDPEVVRRAVDRAWDDLLAEQQEWPSETDCDRLDRAFASLNASGVIALQDAGYTQSDGYELVREAFDRMREGSGDASDVVGYCFFHGQDLDRAIDGGGLYLAFGPIVPELESSEGPKVGQLVVAALAVQGLIAAWDGTFSTRILVPALVWRRRIERTTGGPAISR